jgi:hypothetical protein
MFAFTVAAAGQDIGVPDLVANRLAVMLSEEGDHHNAAIEFRRMALSTDAPPAKAAYHRAAAYEYMRGSNDILSVEQLDTAEKTSGSDMQQIMLLRADNAYAAERYSEAAFYYQVLLDDPQATPAYRQWAARRLAALEIILQSPRDAIRILEQAPGDQNAALQAAEYYRSQHDKKPWLGGLLGLIPGLGYMYSGEYANGTRSILLNSLFIFGMVTTAQEDQWGGFAVITFFEITWYSGSIYGGIDAAHRYNRNRQQNCIDDILNDQSYTADYTHLPLLSFSFDF